MRTAAEKQTRDSCAAARLGTGRDLVGERQPDSAPRVFPSRNAQPPRLLQVPLGKPLLDGGLPLDQPVHRLIQPMGATLPNPSSSPRVDTALSGARARAVAGFVCASMT